MTRQVPNVYPIRLGTPEEFHALREELPRLGFVQDNMEGHFHLRHISEAQFDVQAKGVEASAAFGTLAALFLQGKSVETEHVRQAVGDRTFALLNALGLIEQDGSSGRCIATVAMYATHGLYVVSDRWCGVDGQAFQPPVDVVYPAILGTTRGFLTMIPASSCERFLELCCGTGIAALLAARNGAKHAYAFDIAARSVHFAEFNRRLNELENVTISEGDLYSPAVGRTFDRIVAHPPYVPVLEPKYVFYDGGQDGEHITRRIIQELPTHLEDRSLLVCVSLGSDRVDNPFEQRVRSFLGDRHEEFDIALFVRSEMEPATQALNDVVRGRGSVEQVQIWKEVLQKLKIVSFVFGGIFIYRHGEKRKGYTIRRTMAEKAGLPEIEKLMEWERQVARGEDTAILQRSLLRAASGCRLTANYTLKEHYWAPESQKLFTDAPFKMQLEAPEWTLQLLSECDGSRTGEQLLESMKAQGIIQPETPFHDFADVLTVMVSGGYMSISNV
ncbi:MAG: class I SAM-dependent methyltransferase [Terriglobales bacterium]